MHAIERTLEQLASRLRRRTRLRALCDLSAAVLAVALGLMLLDTISRPSDPGLRYLAALGVLAAGAWLVRKHAGQLLGGGWNMLTAAGRLESLHRSLGSRLSSAIEFLRQPEDDPTAGSADLRRAVIVQSEADLAEAQTDQAARIPGATQSLRRLGLVAAVGAAFAAAAPQSFVLAGYRLAAPWAHAHWPMDCHLVLVDPPQRVARGEPLEIEVIDEQGEPPESVTLQIATEVEGRRTVDATPMRRVGDRFVAQRERVDRSFSVRAFGGDDDTMEWRLIEAVDPPAVQEVAVRVTPAPYTGVAPGPADPHLRVLSGTQVHLEGHADKELQTAEIVVDQRGSGAEARPTALRVAPPNGFSTDGKGWLLRSKLPLQTTYQLALSGPDGLRGLSRPWRLAVEPDPAPTVEWVTPQEDLYLLPGATIPLRVVAQDNLAVASVSIAIQGGHDFVQPDQAEKREDRLQQLWQGPSDPPPQESSFPATPFRTEAAGEFALAPWELKPGQQLTLQAIASDYRPGRGKAPVTRRITVITPEELDSLLAQQQTELSQAVQRSLSQQRTARQRSREAGDLLASEGKVPQALDRLALAAEAQRAARESVTAPRSGGVDIARRIVEQLDQNGLQRPELRGQAEEASQRLASIAAQSMSPALGALRAATQQAGADKDPQQARAEVDRAAERQSAAAEQLEKLADALGSSSELEGLATRLRELLEDQRHLQGKTNEAATSPAAQQAASGERALAEQQGEIARRFEKVRQALDDIANGAAPAGEASSEQASPRAAEALAEAESRGVAARMRDAQRSLQEGAAGKSSQAQAAAAEGLEQMLDALRPGASTDPAERERGLAETLKELEQLRSELAQAQSQQARGENVQPQTKQLAQRSQQAGQRLQRLQASSASQSAQGASGSLGEAAQAGADQKRKEEAQAMRQADQALAEAQQRVQEELDQIEEQRVRMILDQVAEALDRLIPQQRDVLTKTLELDASAEPNSAVGDAPQNLAIDQRGVAKEVEELAVLAAPRAVFEMALLRAADEARAAEAQLAVGESGRPTQRHEHSALAQLQHIAQVLQNEPPPDDQQPKPPGGEGGQGGQPQEQREPPIALAELKLIRLMQLELKAQTAELTAELADSLQSDQQSSAEVAQQADGLSAQQRRLAELVQELTSRNNRQPAPEQGESL